MARKEWSRKRIVDELIALHESGVKLRSTNLPNDIHNALYYRRTDGKRAYFESLGEAREAVARRYEESGDPVSAAEIRALENPIPSPMKFSDKQRAERRIQLVYMLLEKIDDGEDVSYRAQQASDRQFVEKCKRAFGKYKGVFPAAGKEYGDYAKHEKSSKTGYLEMLIGCIKDGLDLDRQSMEEFDEHMVSRLNHFYSGYYDALSEARNVLLKRHDLSAAERVDVDFWRNKRRDDARAEQADNMQRSIDDILEIDRDAEYSAEDIPLLDLDDGQVISGEELRSFLLESDSWYTSTGLSRILGCTAANIRKNLLPALHDKTLKFIEGDKHRYFFHVSALRVYERKNQSVSPDDSVQALADEFGIEYPKVRSMMSSLGIDSTPVDGKHRALSGAEKQLLQRALEREEKLYAKAMGSIDENEDYTMDDLDKLGVPRSYVQSAARKGDVPFVVKGSRNARHVRGSVIMDYLRNNRKHIRLSKGLDMITYFGHGMYTINDLIARLGLSRGTVRYKMFKLLDENPDSCFRIRRSSLRSRLIATEAVLPFMDNWGDRSDLQFISALQLFEGSMRNPASPAELADAVCNLGRMMGGDGVIPSKLNKSAFEALAVLKAYEAESSEIDESLFSNKTLFRLHNYMESHGYTQIDFRNPIFLKDLEEIVSAKTDVSDTIQKVERAIFFGNLRLVHHFMRKYKVDSDRVFDGCCDSLMNAIRKYDASMGATLGTYAGTVIRLKVLGYLKSTKARGMAREVSLNRKIGDGDAEILDFMSSDDVPADERVMCEERKKKIDELLKRLTRREKDVVIRRFGLHGRDMESLEDIGDEYGMSRENIRLIQKSALKKLSRTPLAKKLGDDYL